MDDSDGGFTVIQVRGEADAYTAPRIRSDLSSALGTSAPLVVDLSQATFIDSTVVGILLEGLAEYEKRERALSCSCCRTSQPPKCTASSS